MTVLGFLSLVTFACNAWGWIDDASDAIYGDEDYLEETIENIHYTLFLVMILAILQVVALIQIGNSFTRTYVIWNNICINDPDKVKETLKRIEDRGHLTNWDWFKDYFLCRKTPLQAWQYHSERIADEEFIQFYALRREFLLNRDPLPPYKVPTEDKWLPNNFDYANYQATCLSKFMVSIVSFTPATWVMLWFFIFLVFLFMLMVDGEYLYLAIVWVGLGYLSLIVIYVKDRKTAWILEQLLNPVFLRFHTAFPPEDWKEVLMRIEPPKPPKELTGVMKDPKKHDKHETLKKVEPSEADRLNLFLTNSEYGFESKIVANTGATESSPLVAGKPHGPEKLDGLSQIQRLRAKTRNLVPGWIHVGEARAGLISRLTYGKKAQPNKQHMLMWGDAAGPDVQSYILRVFLIIQSIYVSLVAVYFTSYMYDNYGDWWGTFYLIVALLPEFILYLGFYPRLVMNLTQSSSTGLLKNMQIVKEVIRYQKSQRLVRTLMMLTKLKVASKNKEKAKGEVKKKIYDFSDPEVKAKVEEFRRVFQTYDVDGSGEVDSKELGLMLKSMGMSLTPDEEEQMLIMLDSDNSGSVSMEEFVDWNMENAEVDPSQSEEEMKELAKTIFEMFDTDGGGVITVEEFKQALDAMNSGLTTDEIVAIVTDFDEDGSGDISLEEFEEVIERALRGD